MADDQKSIGAFALDLRFKLIAWSVKSLITLAIAYVIVTYFAVPGWVLPLAVGYILGALGLTLWNWHRGQKALQDYMEEGQNNDT